MKRAAWILFVFVGFLIVGSPPIASAQGLENVQIQPIPVAEGIHMLTGRGGNIGLSTGKDGAFLIDDQFAALTEKIQAEVAKLGEHPVKFLINTHWHADHTGGNENFGKAGAILVAHENVRKRMSTEQFIEAFNDRRPAAPEVALPVVTFTDSVTFHWNGQEIRVFHVENAHTDGDSIIHFTNENVFHMGDTYFNGMYPFIDTGSGGGIEGMIAAADKVLAMADDETKIIPGHGPLSNKKELRAYRSMLATVRNRVREVIKLGMTEDEVAAASLTTNFDRKWGNGFMKPDVWIRIVYKSLQPNGDSIK